MSDSQRPGAAVPAGSAASGEAPSRRAKPVSACSSAAPPSVSERSTRCPASVRCEPASRGVSSRAVTAAMASEAAARPKRASQSCCSGSEFSMVPTASPSAIAAPFAWYSTSRNVSAPSSCASSRMATETVFDVSPAAKASVPLALP